MRTVTRVSISLAIVAVVTATAACAPKKHPAQVAPPSPPSAEGKTTYSFILDPANPALDLPPDVQFMRPMALERKTLPVYPPTALAAHDTPHREVVRIVIDDHGSVGQVADSPMEQSDGGPFAADYRRAVDAAVRTWRFRPGVLEHVRDGEDKDSDGKADYKVMTSWDPVAVYYDIRFKFEILDGKGIVGVDSSKLESR